MQTYTQSQIQIVGFCLFCVIHIFIISNRIRYDCVKTITTNVVVRPNEYPDVFINRHVTPCRRYVDLLFDGRGGEMEDVSIWMEEYVCVCVCARVSLWNRCWWYI